MKPLLKWPGGKERELQKIRENIPAFLGRFLEPFVGGGAVYFDLNFQSALINDKSSELINFYQCIKEKDPEFISWLNTLENEFSLLGSFIDNQSEEVINLYLEKIEIDKFIQTFKSFFDTLASFNHEVFIKELYRGLSDKIKRSSKLENKLGEISFEDRLANMEAAFKSSYYMYVRTLFNDKSNLSKGQNAAVFFFIREFCYSSMFRYSAKGKFNVPYGGISYNRKDFKRKINSLWTSEVKEKLKNTQIYNLDFEEFFYEVKPTHEDFIFLDPPYDTEFSCYANNSFDKNEQIRLAESLKETSALFMLIIKNTNFIYNLYKDDFKIKSFDKKYLASFMNRNEKATEHLIITNY